jgi:DHA1 family bicyclomycin/chloramphenicol resistance-like MFS transporter
MKSTPLSIANVLILLAALTALGPLAIDAYLPAIPTMAISFNTSIHDIEFSLSLFLAGFSLGQLIGGPISDHMGRRLTIFTGLLIFVLGTLGIIFSASLASLLLFRVIEAIGGGIAIVNSSAIIRDISSGKDSARNLSHMAMIMMLAPLFAPMMGSTILHLSDWHSIFIFLLIYTVTISLFIFRHIPETRIKHTHEISTVQRYLIVLKHRRALGFIFAMCCSSAGMFAFITSSPSVYMGYFEVSEVFFPFLFGANIISLIAANRLNVLLLKHYEAHQLLSLGQLIQLISGIVLLSYILLFSMHELAVVVVLVMLFVGSQGLIVSNAISSTIEFFPHNSGTASALLGASGFGAGALTGTLVGILGDGTPLPMASVMAGCILTGISLRFIFQPANRNLGLTLDK